MTDDEVEAVARAIAKSDENDRAGKGFKVSIDLWESGPRHLYERFARAAIFKLDEMRGDGTHWWTKCFECSAELHGPYCPKCNPPEQAA